VFSFGQVAESIPLNTFDFFLFSSYGISLTSHAETLRILQER